MQNVILPLVDGDHNQPRHRLTSEAEYPNLLGKKTALNSVRPQNLVVETWKKLSFCAEPLLVLCAEPMLVHLLGDPFLHGVPSFWDQDILALAKNIPANRPNRILKKLDTLSETLNTSRPAIEMGILFKEPTRL